MKAPQFILDFADANTQISAVILCGSRANPESSVVDVFSDYDIVFVTKSNTAFDSAPCFPEAGELCIVQHPHNGASISTYLMQYMSGLRIDISFVTAAKLSEYLAEEYFAKLLWSREAFTLPTGRRKDAPPTEQDFAECCNEFWWVLPYVVKGMKRGQPTYANWHLENCLRNELFRMLGWLYMKQGIHISKCGKNLNTVMDSGDFKTLVSTYCAAVDRDIAAALKNVCRLFSKYARMTAAAYGFQYNEAEERKVTAFAFSMSHS